MIDVVIGFFSSPFLIHGYYVSYWDVWFVFLLLAQINLQRVLRTSSYQALWLEESSFFLIPEPLTDLTRLTGTRHFQASL